MTKHHQHWPDIRFFAVAENHGHYIDFKVFSTSGEDDKGVIFYNDEGPLCDQPTRNINEASVFMHGTVKWDGCCNWHIDSQDRSMLHFCEKEDIQNLAEALIRCRALAEQLMGDTAFF